MAQNIKYCDPSLTTGLDNGTSKANAWKTLATANTNAVANDRVYVRSNVGGTAYELTTNPGINFNVAGTLGAPRTFIAFDWDTDTEVCCTNFVGYGGTVGVLINYNNATAFNFGVQIGAAANEVIGFQATRTGTLMAYAFVNAGAAAGSRFYLCKAIDFTTIGIYSNQVFSIINCIADTGPTGFVGSYGCENCVAKDCSTAGFNDGVVNSSYGLAIGCAIGVIQAGAVTKGTANFAFYNCGVGVRVSAVHTLLLKNIIIENCTTGIDVQTTAKKLIAQNVSHYNNTNLYGGSALASSFIEEQGVYASPVSLFKNVAGGDYSNNPAAAVLKQYQNRLLENTYDYTQPGLGQPMVAAGGGAQLGAFETGAWR